MLRGSCRVLLPLAALALIACDDDEGPSDPVIDGGADARVDDKLDAKVDAQPSDAKVDAASDASASCTLDQSYVIATSGGLMSNRNSYVLSASGKLTVTNVAESIDPDAGVRFSCSVDLPACGSAKVDSSDLAAAFQAPGVIAAFGDGSKVLGFDSRPMDGSVWVFQRADGKRILLGGPCNGASGCTAIPADVEALGKVIGDLFQQTTLGQQDDGGLAGTCDI